MTLAEKRQIEQAKREQVHAEAERLEKEGITFGQFFDETYLPLAEITKKPGTIRTEKIHFEQWLKPVIGDLPFREISPFHLEKVKKAMLGAELTPRSIQYCLATFRQCWNAARNAGLDISETPSRKVKIPKIDNRRMRFLTHEEADALLKDLSERSQQLHDMALVALHCGLRAGEIFNLTRGDVDLSRVRVISQLEASGDLKKAGGEAYIIGLLESVGTSAGMPHYSETVKVMADRRRLIQLAMQTAQKCYDLSRDLGEISAEVMETIRHLQGGHRQDLSDNLTLIKRVFADVELRAQKGQFFREHRGDPMGFSHQGLQCIM